jgi:hypothetical protein
MTSFDQFLLNILYDPRVRPGMTKDEVNRVLPDVLPTVRAWITDASRARHSDERNGPGANSTQALTTALLRSMNAQTNREKQEINDTHARAKEFSRTTRSIP